MFSIGQPALFDELEAADVGITADPSVADLLVVGKDRSFDLGTLTRVLHALDDGVPFVVTNMDRVSPTSDGLEPGTGALVGSLVGASDREPDVVTGKPHDAMIDAMFDRLGVSASDCLVVGDSLESDIAMGHRAGMTTVLVLSGIADHDGAEVRSVEPDHVVESMAELDEVLDAERG